MTTEELENYEPKGQLEGFPKEIINRMLDCQKEQVDRRDVTVFENLTRACPDINGFSWNKTKEGYDFWEAVIEKRNFDLFFEKYPKKDNQDNSQEFRVGDKVIDIILNLKGEIINIKSNGNLEIQFEGKCGLTEYNLKIEKRASLLHYRDDYNYDIIDFNNLPKRQEPKRWRAKVRGKYYSFTSKFEVEDFYDTKRFLDNEAYELGNYFQTKEEAENIAQKLNTYFKQLIAQ